MRHGVLLLGQLTIEVSSVIPVWCKGILWRGKGLLGRHGIALGLVS